MKKDNGKRGLYTPQLEHDACGIGFVANLKGQTSHQIIKDALTMLENMEHRGGRGAEPETGDGAGILIQNPHTFFQKISSELDFKLPDFGNYGVGMLFLPKDSNIKASCKSLIQGVAQKLDLEILAYRKVPVNREGIGKTALSQEPDIEQVFITSQNNITPEELERKLYILKSYTSNQAIEQHILPNPDLFYWASLSYKILVYKGQLGTDQLRTYYLDLQDERLESKLAQVHSRFSTNTFPKWKLAQPFRYLAHNGEINTIRGNTNWMRTKESLLESSLFSKEELEMLFPICDKGNSDSANLDTAVELMVLAGRSIAEVMMILIPEAWQANEQMSEEKKAYYEYYSSLMEPWDGPASVCFTDGKVIGATLDRNGLRPSRYLVTEDGMLVMASETGVLPIDESKVIEKGRLQPGKIFVADLEEGRIIRDDELKNKICQAKPYQKWLQENKLSLDMLPSINGQQIKLDEATIETRQLAFGYTQEDLRTILIPMVKTSKEPVGSMGADIPLAVFSQKAQHLSYYFKQLFAQVSNPPIDPIREKIIMSLYGNLGPIRNILDATPEHCQQIHIAQPVLHNTDLKKLIHITHPNFKSKVLHSLFPATEKEGELEKAIEALCLEAEKAILEGVNILILSDQEIDENHAPIPSLMITGAIHHHLTQRKLRANASIVVSSGDVRETHHYATLLGYGANAINPYLAFESILKIQQMGLLEQELEQDELFGNYIKAIGYGLRKIFSKMGISTIQSYQGAQIFEILGIGDKVVNKCFTDSISRIGGLDFDDIAKGVLMDFRQAFPKSEIPNRMLDIGGVYQWKKEGEYHIFNPTTIHYLQKAVRTGNFETYQKYAENINDQVHQACTIRGLLEFQNQESIPLEDVEPVESILKRFATGAMSFGSISYEAHSTLAVAMNRIGAKSNSGEGGEDEVRFEKKENGDWERSAIKQVASGRFGVTSYYLTNAEELQIKMAQGAKPGEGGQLPGHKVDEWIGRVRHSTPGVGLISPPPHHDIYSIEDLAQLIYDLKNANREARINVKLVSEAGVGTIAAGVAKAKADVVLIAGQDGGTGASPISSIRHAGLPWELGLAETHQTLVKNRLRSRIVVQTDGQLRTGRDLAIATLLGAEEWGIATAALVAEGCIMMRKCHLNTCPVGIATQNPELRKKFNATPEQVVNFFTFLAEDLRMIMAELGFRTINEMVGQVQKLKIRDNIDHWKLKDIDLSPILYKEEEGTEAGLYQQIEQDHGLDDILDWQLFYQAKATLNNQEFTKRQFPIISTNRAVGTMLSNEVSKKYKGKGLTKGSLHYQFKGSAGQSFGAFAAPGLRFELEGDANDYFGKGLSGAELIVYPHKEAQIVPEDNIIIGNVAFYGATAGEAYIRGVAGERFCVRNSGVRAVVEGIGDHGCEYMTGGIVVVLGSIGRNFAAGMSGGLAYLFDPDKQSSALINTELVDIDPVDELDVEHLHQILTKHQQYTQSTVASQVLQNWSSTQASFIKIMPRDYKAILKKQKAELVLESA